MDDARGATERLENREVELEDDGGVRDHQRLVLMGRIAHRIPTVMKRILRTKAPGPPPNILGGCGGKFKCSKSKKPPLCCCWLVL